MDPTNYKNFWDNKATSYIGALIAVDGSSDESSVMATGERSANQVSAALDLKPTDRVLEIGCGVARIGVPLASRVEFWQGVDISQNMVNVAAQRLAGSSNVAVQALTRPALPFADASFDAVYSIAVFIHMDKEDFFIYLREMFRVLKPGGRVYFDHWNLAHAIGFKRFLYEANFYDKHGDVSVRKDVARNQFTTPQEVEVFLKQAGFHVTEIMDDTCWVQALAIKGDSKLLVSERSRIAENYERINYGQAWTTYFDWVLPVIFEGLAPREVLNKLAVEPETEVRSMYEKWLYAAWRNNPTHYGPVL
jgi:ubiquinone/menaquinone biosynthesis C-methylase UbiE